MAFLPAESLDFSHGDSLYADRGQRFTCLVKLERLDDCSDQFHRNSLGLKQRGRLAPASSWLEKRDLSVVVGLFAMVGQVETLFLCLVAGAYADRDLQNQHNHKSNEA